MSDQNTNQNIKKGTLVIVSAGDGGGKDTLIKKCQEGINYTEPVSFLLSDPLNDGSSCRPNRVENGEIEAEPNRVWIDRTIYKLLVERDLVLTFTDIKNGGWSGRNDASKEDGGYSYITLKNLDRNNKDRDIWEMIGEIQENKNNPAFKGGQLMAMGVDECLNQCINEGKTYITQGHADWIPGFLRKIQDKRVDLPIVIFGLVGLSEQTSFRRQTVGRNDDPEIAKVKAIESFKQNKTLIAMANSGLYPGFYKLAAIGSHKAESGDKQAREEFVQNRVNWMKKVVELETQIFYLKKELEESVTPQEPLIGRITELNRQLKNVREYGVESLEEDNYLSDMEKTRDYQQELLELRQKSTPARPQSAVAATLDDFKQFQQQINGEAYNIYIQNLGGDFDGNRKMASLYVASQKIWGQQFFYRAIIRLKDWGIDIKDYKNFQEIWESDLLLQDKQQVGEAIFQIISESISNLENKLERQELGQENKMLVERKLNFS